MPSKSRSISANPRKPSSRRRASARDAKRSPSGASLTDGREREEAGKSSTRTPPHQRVRTASSQRALLIDSDSYAGPSGRDAVDDAWLPSMAENLTNHAVENAAIEYVLAYERGHGREAQDTRRKGAAADVESDGRIIEVKAFGGYARGEDLWLEPRQFETARSDPSAFRVYVVENVRQGDPDLFRLIDLHGERLARLIDRAREKRYFMVPLPVAEYDAAVAELDGSRPIGPGLSGMQEGPTADFGDG